ncbi:hypothetical protein Skr01_64790 [Sphaerisporangium krabiense]|nr:hypothetical protein Skr01_64790 [Sphaerisporangium krabiense]
MGDGAPGGGGAGAGSGFLECLLGMPGRVCPSVGGAGKGEWSGDVSWDLACRCGEAGFFVSSSVRGTG